jgi:hypothetical protein
VDAARSSQPARPLLLHRIGSGCKGFPAKQLRRFFDHGQSVTYIRSAEGLRLFS